MRARHAPTLIIYVVAVQVFAGKTRFDLFFQGRSEQFRECSDTDNYEVIQFNSDSIRFFLGYLRCYSFRFPPKRFVYFRNDIVHVVMISAKLNGFFGIAIGRDMLYNIFFVLNYFVLL